VVDTSLIIIHLQDFPWLKCTKGWIRNYLCNNGLTATAADAALGPSRASKVHNQLIHHLSARINSIIFALIMLSKYEVYIQILYSIVWVNHFVCL